MVNRSDVSRETIRYSDLGDYVAKSGKRKQFIAKNELLIDPPRFSELLNHEFYRPRVDDELVERIAALLNQTPAYVRRLYPKAA